MRGSSLLLVLALAGCANDAGPSSAPTTPGPATTTASQGSTRDVSVVLRDAAIAEEAYSIDYQTYTTDVSQLVAAGMKPQVKVAFRVISASKTAYCMSGSTGGTTLYYTSTTGQISATACH